MFVIFQYEDDVDDAPNQRGANQANPGQAGRRQRDYQQPQNREQNHRDRNDGVVQIRNAGPVIELLEVGI